MKIGIAGFGVEGKAAADYYRSLGHEVTVCDEGEEQKLPQGISGRWGSNSLHSLDDFDLIVRSPGIRPDRLETRRPITSATKEFLQKCPAPIIGVTGTKGKGTTSALIYEILQANGNKAWLGGNIGIPPLTFLSEVQPEDVVVLELSSFQLMDVEQSPQTAVVLMISEDHLDWHVDMDEYIEAKTNLVRFQKPGDRTIFYMENSISCRIADASPGTKVPFPSSESAEVKDDWVIIKGERIIPVEKLGLIGPHNHQNVCAAVTAAWDYCQNKMVLSSVLENFKGLPHRLERVGEVNGVLYVNDSFSTNPQPTIAAIKSFAAPKIIILGGSDKGADFNEMAKDILHGGVKKAILIGSTAEKIAKALQQAEYHNYEIITGKMPEIMMAAAHAAEPGDVVLLSPACASFGLFSNYKDRGEQFKQQVLKLKEAEVAN